MREIHYTRKRNEGEGMVVPPPPNVLDRSCLVEHVGVVLQELRLGKGGRRRGVLEGGVGVSVSLKRRRGRGMGEDGGRGGAAMGRPHWDWGRCRWEGKRMTQVWEGSLRWSREAVSARG